MDVHIRPLQASDKPFVFSTMLRGLYYGNDFYRQIDKDSFYANYSSVVERLFETSDVRIACLPDDHDVILAYVIEQHNILHWAFTKAAFRKQGLFKQLTAGSAISVCTHLTQRGNMLRLTKGWKFDPFLL